MTTTQPAPKLLLSVEEAAELLGVSRSTMYDLMRTRAIASVRIGRCRRISLDALRRYVERLPAETVDPITWARTVR
jgi:excisionase family DNA binding protein